MTKGEPRPDHIALLTRDTTLPLARIEDEHLDVILKAITAAWQDLQALGKPALTQGSEPEVNAALIFQLNHRCQDESCWKGLVHSVQSGRESISFNGAKLEKRPDLSLIFLHGNRNFPMVAECKIVDHPNRKDIGLYCDKGIARFVCGDYAWTNREAIMLAYVRDGSTVPSKLTHHLARSANAQPDPLLTASMPGPREGFPADVHFTTHGRPFQYLPCCDGTDPGEITLAHLWLGSVHKKTI